MVTNHLMTGRTSPFGDLRAHLGYVDYLAPSTEYEGPNQRMGATRKPVRGLSEAFRSASLFSRKSPGTQGSSCVGTNRQ